MFHSPVLVLDSFLLPSDLRLRFLRYLLLEI